MLPEVARGEAEVGDAQPNQPGTPDVLAKPAPIPAVVNDPPESPIMHGHLMSLLVDVVTIVGPPLREKRNPQFHGLLPSLRISRPGKKRSAALL